MIEDFLHRVRQRARLAVLLVDARHAPTELDGLMHDWLVGNGIPRVVAATKADKLSASARARVVAAVRSALGPDPEESPAVLVSATTGLGIRELLGRIESAIGART